jgi:hypothetical protein
MTLFSQLTALPRCHHRCIGPSAWLLWKHTRAMPADL